MDPLDIILAAAGALWLIGAVAWMWAGTRGDREWWR